MESQKLTAIGLFESWDAFAEFARRESHSNPPSMVVVQNGQDAKPPILSAKRFADAVANGDEIVQLVVADGNTIKTVPNGLVNWARMWREGFLPVDALVYGEHIVYRRDDHGAWYEFLASTIESLPRTHIVLSLWLMDKW